MKATLKFDLSDHDQRQEHRRCINATNVYIAFNNIDTELRNMVKYNKVIGSGKQFALPKGFHTITEKESILLSELVSYIRNLMRGILEENKIDLDDLN